MSTGIEELHFLLGDGDGLEYLKRRRCGVGGCCGGVETFVTHVSQLLEVLVLGKKSCFGFLFTFLCSPNSNKNTHF